MLQILCNFVLQCLYNLCMLIGTFVLICLRDFPCNYLEFMSYIGGCVVSFNFLQDILSSEVIKNIILNTIFVSIPEEFFWVMFIYIMMGEFDHWKDPANNKFFYKEDYVRVFVPVITASILSNILRYSGVDNNIVSLVTIFVLFFSIVLFGDIFNNSGALKWIGKVFLFLVLGLAVIFLCESLYIPLILYGTGIELRDLNNDVLKNVLVSLPSRLLQYLILIFIVARKRSLGVIDIKKLLIDNKWIFGSFSFLLFFHIIFMVFMTKLIAVERLLISLQFSIRLIAIIIISAFPLINIISFIIIAYQMKKTEHKKKQAVYLRVEQIANDVDSLMLAKEKTNDMYHLQLIRDKITELINLIYFY